jgi:hypothetical protein
MVSIPGVPEISRGKFFELTKPNFVVLIQPTNKETKMQTHIKTKQRTLDEKSLFLRDVTVDDLPNLTRRSPLVPIIQRLAEKLDNGEGREINEEAIKGGTWASVVRKMKANKELGPEFNVERRGEKYYFMRRGLKQAA